MVHSLFKTDVLEKLAGSIADFFSRKFTLKLHWELNVFKSGEGADQVKGLENEAQLVQTDRGQQGVSGRELDSKSTDVDITLGWLVNGSNDIQKSSLTTTRGSKNGDEFSLLNGNVDTSESRNTFNTEKIGLVDVDDLDDLTRSLIDLTVVTITVFFILVLSLIHSTLSCVVVILTNLCLECAISIVMDELRLFGG